MRPNNNNSNNNNSNNNNSNNNKKMGPLERAHYLSGGAEVERQNINSIAHQIQDLHRDVGIPRNNIPSISTLKTYKIKELQNMRRTLRQAADKVDIHRKAFESVYRNWASKYH